MKNKFSLIIGVVVIMIVIQQFIGYATSVQSSLLSLLNLGLAIFAIIKIAKS